MPDFYVNIWYDTPQRQRAAWDQVVYNVRNSSAAVQRAMVLFDRRHVDDLNVTEVHVKQTRESEWKSELASTFWEADRGGN
jgi:hypothetical protein